MRIAFHYDLPPSRPTGIGKYALNLADGLSSRDVDLELWVYHGWRRDLQELTGNRYKLRSLYHLGGLGDALLPAALRSISGAQLVHCPNGVLLRTGSVPQSATIHDMTPFMFPDLKSPGDTESSRRRISEIAERADLIISNSRTTRDDFLSLFPSAEQRTHVVYMGVDHRVASGFEAERPCTSGGPGHILAVGTVELRKNYSALLRAYSRLLGELSVCPQLVIAGGMGFGSESVVEECESLGLSSRVTFTGYTDDKTLEGLYRGAACFVHVALYEGFGFPVAEAMGFGLPVVASSNSSVLEIFGGAAHMVDPEDPESISSGLRTALEEGTSTQQEEERKRLFARMSWDTCIGSTLELFDGIIRRSPG
jgi:glycosyltransferase involved in cell wall biosynthesis